VLGAAAIDRTDIAGRVAEATADTRALRQLTLLILGGLACTLFIVAFLILAAMQAVSMIDESSRAREMAQVIRYDPYAGPDRRQIDPGVRRRAR
jgi:hypothetical protein